MIRKKYTGSIRKMISTYGDIVYELAISIGTLEGKRFRKYKYVYSDDNLEYELLLFHRELLDKYGNTLPDKNLHHLKKSFTYLLEKYYNKK